MAWMSNGNSGHGSRRSSLTSRASIGSRLGAIDEDGGMHPDPIPPSSPSRSHHKGAILPFNLGHRNTHDHDPPPYSEWDGMTGSGRERLDEARKSISKSRRGGWYRILVMVGFGILVIIGLVVGLVFGLRRAHHHKHSSKIPSITRNQTQVFPAGSYSFITFLDIVQTDCTSNPATWQCYPYNTINQSTTASMATFNWVIEATGANDSSFVISSTDNPFAITFTNATLSLINSGLDTESYTFSTSLDKTVIPTTALTSDGSASECMYNATTFTAYLYTKMAKTYPSSNSTNSSASFVQWPYAMEVSQTISGGSSVPDCYKTENGTLTEKITLATESASKTCGCLWQNYGT